MKREGYLDHKKGSKILLVDNIIVHIKIIKLQKISVQINVYWKSIIFLFNSDK